MSFKLPLYLQSTDLIDIAIAALIALVLLVMGAFVLRDVLRIPMEEREVPERMLDILIASLILLLALPGFLLIVLLVKLASPGPVFTRSHDCSLRYGLNGRIFRVWRFRTMVKSTRSSVHRLPFSQDPRLTLIGLWLKKTGLDVLPEFINVLTCDMSVFGPKPLLLQDLTSRDKFPTRLNVMPGVISAGEMAGYKIDLLRWRVVRQPDQDKLFSMEEAYIRRMSPWLYVLLFLKATLIFFARLMLRVEEEIRVANERQVVFMSVPGFFRACARQLRVFLIK